MPNKLIIFNSIREEYEFIKKNKLDERYLVISGTNFKNLFEQKENFQKIVVFESHELAKDICNFSYFYFDNIIFLDSSYTEIAEIFKEVVYYNKKVSLIVRDERKLIKRFRNNVNLEKLFECFNNYVRINNVYIFNDNCRIYFNSIIKNNTFEIGVIDTKNIYDLKRNFEILFCNFNMLGIITISNNEVENILISNRLLESSDEKFISLNKLEINRFIKLLKDKKHIKRSNFSFNFNELFI